jgi:hypothetical protein
LNERAKARVLLLLGAAGLGRKGVARAATARDPARARGTREAATQAHPLLRMEGMPIGRRVSLDGGGGACWTRVRRGAEKVRTAVASLEGWSQENLGLASPQCGSGADLTQRLVSRRIRVSSILWRYCILMPALWAGTRTAAVAAALLTEAS